MLASLLKRSLLHKGKLQWIQQMLWLQSCCLGVIAQLLRGLLSSDYRQPITEETIKWSLCLHDLLSTKDRRQPAESTLATQALIWATCVSSLEFQTLKRVHPTCYSNTIKTTATRTQIKTSLDKGFSKAIKLTSLGLKWCSRPPHRSIKAFNWMAVAKRYLTSIWSKTLAIRSLPTKALSNAKTKPFSKTGSSLDHLMVHRSSRISSQQPQRWFPCIRSHWLVLALFQLFTKASRLVWLTCLEALMHTMTSDFN